MDFVLDESAVLEYRLNAVKAGALQINEQWVDSPCVLMSDRFQADWPVYSLDAFDESRAQELIAWQPELVLFGCSNPLAVADSWRICFFKQNIGVELMSIESAARTYVALASEGRRVMGFFCLTGQKSC
jgi:uncharacterized protein